MSGRAPLGVTVDVDWAPDFAIEHVAGLLAEHGVRSTWFVTHASPAIEKLATQPALFELGIHPNFGSGSSHGDTPEEVLRHCMELVPGARSMRSHGLIQSSALLQLALDTTPIETDVSIYLPGAANVEPVPVWMQGRRLLRIPYVWEDDGEFVNPAPSWDPEPVAALPGESKILNFHPIHVWLNSSSAGPYDQLKREQADLVHADEETAQQFVTNGAGTGTMFSALVELLAKHQTWTVADLAETT